MLSFKIMSLQADNPDGLPRGHLGLLFIERFVEWWIGDVNLTTHVSDIVQAYRGVARAAG